MSVQENIGYQAAAASAEMAPDIFQSPNTERARGNSDASSEDSVRQYLLDIGQHPLITKKEEVELAQTIDVGKAARERIKQGMDGVSEEQIEALSKEIKFGEDAAKRLTNSNLRLVVSIAKRYTGTGVPILDLIQEGNFGLIHAVEKFDWRMGFKFSTYATWWIRQAIQRGLANTGGMIRLPTNKNDRVVTLNKARRELEGYGIDPTAENLARYKNRPVDYFEKSIELDGLVNPLYLDADSDKGDGGRMYARPNSLGDNIADSESADGYLEAETGFLNSSIYDILGRLLDERETRIIELRFGLNGQGGDRLTLDQLAEEFKVTRETVRRVESRALSKLGHPTNGGLPAFADEDAPEWFDDAACKGLPTDIFYPLRGDTNKVANDVCETCLVKRDCLEYALERTEPGVWGGTSERERKRMRRASRVAALAVSSQTT